jgi:hypothetical protein
MSWRVTFAMKNPKQNSPFLDGILVIRHDLRRISRLDESEIILDSRPMHPNEIILTGRELLFDLFSLRIPSNPLSLDSLVMNRSSSYSISMAKI